MCYVSHVIRHMSHIPTATYPHPADSPTMHWRVVKGTQKHLVCSAKNHCIAPKKGVLSIPIIAIRSATISLQFFQFPSEGK